LRACAELEPAGTDADGRATLDARRPSFPKPPSLPGGRDAPCMGRGLKARGLMRKTWSLVARRRRIRTTAHTTITTNSNPPPAAPAAGPTNEALEESGCEAEELDQNTGVLVTAVVLGSNAVVCKEEAVEEVRVVAGDMLVSRAVCVVGLVTGTEAEVVGANAGLAELADAAVGVAVKAVVGTAVLVCAGPTVLAGPPVTPP
jgi:hypothetical protein